ncbi:MAG: glycosyltransferase [Salinivirgaceae bacterium]|nr:glycosyltransferase [Salinivirgaceae bacterium]
MDKFPPYVFFLVVSQKEDSYKEEQINSRIKLILDNSVGLSKSRNIIIKNVETKWLWIQDDDISLNFKEFEQLLSLLKGEVSDAVFIKVLSCENTAEYYKSYTFHKKHSLLNALKISSIEILVNVDFIKKNKITFNEKLGLGTNMPCCEENKFVLDIFKESESVSYFDVAPCSHTTLIENRNIDHEKRFVARGYFLHYLPVYISSILLLRWAWNIRCDLTLSKKLSLMLKSYSRCLFS